MKYAVVAVGYNRKTELTRLLKSLEMAQVDENLEVDLIISLDYSDKQKSLSEIGENTIWKNGEKIIKKSPERLGLRRHMIQCGDLTSKYDCVIVLEDDIVVAEGFMQYVVECVEKYKDEKKVAGISLYTHRINPGNGRSFEAQYNGMDVLALQYAQS